MRDTLISWAVVAMGMIVFLGYFALCSVLLELIDMSDTKAERAERQRLDRVMQAGTPRAPGYPHRRVS